MGPEARIERLAHETIGAAIKVHRHLGPGFLESVYEAALAVELANRNITCERQVRRLSEKNVPDCAEFSFVFKERQQAHSRAVCNCWRNAEDGRKDKQAGMFFDRSHLSIGVSYQGVKVGESRLDLLVESVLVVELKAVDMLLPIRKAQLLSYLNALHLSLGLLINFKVQAVRQGIQRVILSN